MGEESKATRERKMQELEVHSRLAQRSVKMIRYSELLDLCVKTLLVGNGDEDVLEVLERMILVLSNELSKETKELGEERGQKKNLSSCSREI